MNLSNTIVDAMLIDSELAPRLRSAFSELTTSILDPTCVADRSFKIDKSGAYNLFTDDSTRCSLPSRLTLVRGFLGPERVRLSRDRILNDAPWKQPVQAALSAEKRRTASNAERRAAIEAGYSTLHLSWTQDTWQPSEVALLKSLVEQVTGRMFNSATLWRLGPLHAVNWFSWFEETPTFARPMAGTAVAMVFLGGGDRLWRLRCPSTKSNNNNGEILVRAGDLCLMDGGFCMDDAWRHRLESGSCGSDDIALVAWFMCRHGKNAAEVLETADASKNQRLLESAITDKALDAASSSTATSVVKQDSIKICDAVTEALLLTLPQTVSEAVTQALDNVIKPAEVQEAACQVDVKELECVQKSIVEPCSKSSIAGLPQINLLQLLYMAHGPVEINLPGSYQLDRTKDGVHACISFMPSFLNKNVAESFMESLKQDLSWKQLTSATKDGKERQEPRLTCYVGPDFEICGYKFENCNEWHPTLRDLKEIVEKAVGRQFNACLSFMFRNGRDSLGWHCEKEKPLGEHPYIASVSLGQARYIEFTRKGREDRNVRLRSAHSDLVVTEGAIEDLYLHRIPKDQMARRVNYMISFRNVNP